MIKFKTIVTAFCFSPTLSPLLRQANKICKIYQANMILIHVGSKNSKKEQELNNVLEENGMSKNEIKIIWQEGKVKDVILKKTEENNADLLIIGALKKENILKYYLGSVARNLSRYSKCSTLILSKLINLKNFDKIIVNTNEKNQIPILSSSVYLANKLNSKYMYITKEISMPNMNILEESSDDEIQVIKDNYISEANKNYKKNLNKIEKIVDINPNLKIKFNALIGKKGYKIKTFARGLNSDLLIMESPNRRFGFIDRVFTNDIEFILSDLPCNLLILHNKN